MENGLPTIDNEQHVIMQMKCTQRIIWWPRQMTLIGEECIAKQSDNEVQNKIREKSGTKDKIINDFGKLAWLGIHFAIRKQMTSISEESAKHWPVLTYR